VLIDPARKDAFGKLCHAQDMTPSHGDRSAAGLLAKRVFFAPSYSNS
jgi:hypothetical protein